MRSTDASVGATDNSGQLRSRRVQFRIDALRHEVERACGVLTASREFDDTRLIHPFRISHLYSEGCMASIKALLIKLSEFGVFLFAQNSAGRQP
ncbi:hypothetical protein CEXT_743281 [Caerostris extrusa]|uniref:Uncharacterized protein n=1 Tax=Caerostris extrusa TaxID=172846 RepID=A0AAV4VTT3_CAEEX|nr:hypothetical protein CEXT_743281 [Caerostris extrusa]